MITLSAALSCDRHEPPLGAVPGEGLTIYVEHLIKCVLLRPLRRSHTPLAR